MCAVLLPAGARAQSPSPAPSSTPSYLQGTCLHSIDDLARAATWLGAYANATKLLLGPPLIEPGDPQQKAYEAFNLHAEQFKKIAANEDTPQFAKPVGALRSAYERGVALDQLVVEYSESLGAYRSESQTDPSEPLENLPPNAAPALKGLRDETLKRADLLRTALADLWTALNEAKSDLATIANAKRDCRP